MDLSGYDLDNVARTILSKAGTNATPASMAAVASVIAAGGYNKSPTEIVHVPINSPHGMRETKERQTILAPTIQPRPPEVADRQINVADEDRAIRSYA